VENQGKMPGQMEEKENPRMSQGEHTHFGPEIRFGKQMKPGSGPSEDTPLLGKTLSTTQHPHPPTLPNAFPLDFSLASFVYLLSAFSLDCIALRGSEKREKSWGWGNGKSGLGGGKMQ